ncbi:MULTISPECIES: succinate dehydrogenase [Pyrobaculum]|uniref:Succinate dehydrogenase subunit C n=2 Tax=Pyrobaculum arsenaticum TaxID=121277 RepID=A4WND6_PYRAR|nr:succinate dehydrogenase [Pyrobaculum arsenaticum]ABP51903.1 succinate dehydrogenase subunit C [Pyrobaculum arsenaticum DSM 13514]MCY0889369.1 succinate dehydrogenase [Pyrobaculum arsenaticum]NYR15593.1 succinate dehydrogenase [Pyrobaculum arsenaticum]
MKSGKGIGEWFRYVNYERAFFTVQRLSGIYLVLYLFGRVFSDALLGWSYTESFDSTLLGRLLGALFFVFIAFHGLNGLRIALIEFGIIKGWPIRDPIKPLPALRTSTLHKLYIAFMIIVGIVAAIYMPYLTFFGQSFHITGP